MFDGLAPKAPSRGNWISLESALSWLAFGRACETAELAEIVGERYLSEAGHLREKLTVEWKSLADAGCEDSLQIRARDPTTKVELSLSTNELRNYRHVGWIGEPQMFVIDRFPFTFSGGFEHRASGAQRGFVEPVIWRKDLIAYKRARARWSRPLRVPDYEAAERFLEADLPLREKHTGHKPEIVEALMAFGISRSKATTMWTEGARKYGIPLHGRCPQKLKK